MTEWIWINGKTMPLADARVGIEDRGFQFADGVYEVIRLYDGIPFTLIEHLQRLERSAAAIEISLPVHVDALAAEIRKLIAHSGIGEGMIYLQLTRGAAPRNHVMPDDISPTLLFYPRPLPPIPAPGTAPRREAAECRRRALAALLDQNDRVAAQHPGQNPGCPRRV